MKILMIAPTPFFADRGCHMRILEETRALEKLGHKVTICTYHHGRNIDKLDIKRSIKIPWYNKLDVGPSFHLFYLDFLLLLKTLKTSFTEKYDIIYAHLQEGALIGWITKLFIRKKLIFDCQDSLVKELEGHNFTKKDSLFYKFMWKLEKLAYNKSDLIITSTTGMKKFLEKNKINKKIIVVEDGVNTDFFNPNVKKANLKLPKNKKIVVYLGGLQKYKGIDYLLNAIPYTSKKFHFLIMGYPEVEKCKKIVEDLGVSERVTFTGKIKYEEAPSYLALGDIAVSPKTLESKEANAKLYNYMGMGLPIVCFDYPDNRKILGDLGVYAKLKDSKDLSKEIKKVRVRKIDYSKVIKKLEWIGNIRKIGLK